MNSKDNFEKQEQTQEYSEQEQAEASQKPAKKKKRFKFDEKDMISVTYDFWSVGWAMPTLPGLCETNLKSQDILKRSAKSKY